MLEWVLIAGALGLAYMLKTGNTGVVQTTPPLQNDMMLQPFSTKSISAYSEENIKKQNKALSNMFIPKHPLEIQHELVTATTPDFVKPPAVKPWMAHYTSDYKPKILENLVW